MENQSRETTSSCKECNDTGIIFYEKDGLSYSRICQCQEKKRYENMLKNSGVGERFLNIGFKELKPVNPVLVSAMKLSKNYCLNFLNIEKSRNNSIAFLGSPGAGKTHLSIAIANNLMANNIGVLYMPYRDAMAKLSQCRFDEENYQREINKYKTARVLLIDDLFKGLSQRRNEFEINTMFEIINFRYLGSKPIVISSEFIQDRLLDFDEALGSRIIEMCKGKITEFVGTEYNYRLKIV